MIVALIGTPSPLTYLAINLLRAIVQVTCGEHDMIGVNTLAGLRSAWPQRDPKRLAVVVASDMPHPHFVDFLLAAKVPTVLCLEPLDKIVAFMISCRQIDGVSALRIATHSLSCLETIATDTPPAVLKMGAFHATLAHIVSDLLRFCNEDDDDVVVAQALLYLGFGGRGQMPFSQFLIEGRASLFPDPTQGTGLTQEQNDVAFSYNQIVAGGRLLETYWPPSCFLQADTPGIHLGAAFDLEGRARFLSHGPYFHLPAGLWVAEVAIEVSESRSENRLGLEVFCGAIVAACVTTLPQEGSLACDMAFRVTDPGTPVEIRIQLLSGAIEGKLRLEGVTLKRL